MERDENSIFRVLGYRKDDIARIKTLFSGSDNLLVALRNHLLGFEMTSEDKSHIAMLTPSDVEMLRKMFIPVADRDTKFGFLGTDLFASLDLSLHLKENAETLLEARRWALRYLNERFSVISGGTEAMHLNTDSLVCHEARRAVLTQVDNTLANIHMVAAKSEEETADEMKKRAQDSAE